MLFWRNSSSHTDVSISLHNVSPYCNVYGWYKLNLTNDQMLYHSSEGNFWSHLNYFLWVLEVATYDCDYLSVITISLSTVTAYCWAVLKEIYAISQATAQVLFLLVWSIILLSKTANNFLRKNTHHAKRSVISKIPGLPQNAHFFIHTCRCFPLAFQDAVLSCMHNVTCSARKPRSKHIS
jgi:hypothetical protein